MKEALWWSEGRSFCRGRPVLNGRGRRQQGDTVRSRNGSMIRHVFCSGRLRGGQGLAPPVSALAIAVIEAAFFGLLMTTIGEAVLSEAGEFATGVAAIDLLLITIRADEEQSATARRGTKALPKNSLTIIKHVNPGQDGQPRPKMGKCGPTRTCASETEHPRKNPGCSSSRGFIFCSRPGMLTKGERGRNACGDDADKVRSAWSAGTACGDDDACSDEEGAG